MIPAVPAFILCVLAFLAGYLARPYEEKCPRAVKGYDCRGGGYCDHSEALLRRAQLDMALAREDDDKGNNPPYRFRP